MGNTLDRTKSSPLERIVLALFGRKWNKPVPFTGVWFAHPAPWNGGNFQWQPVVYRNGHGGELIDKWFASEAQCEDYIARKLVTNGEVLDRG